MSDAEQLNALQENLAGLNIVETVPAGGAPSKPAARGRIKLADFELLRVIGRGAFGEARVVRMKETGEVFAMKAMKKSEMLKKKQVEHVRAERDVLALANCPWVVKLRYSFQDESYLYLVMEYLQGGDFMTILMKYDILTEEQTRFYVAEIALALESVHRLGYIHRDLKPDNILLDREGHIKLSDFGLCKGVGVPQPEIVKKAAAAAGGSHLEPPQSDEQDGLPRKERAARWKRRSRQLAFSTVGTPDYIAPEVFAQTGYSYAADLWSLGVIMYESLVGYAPYASDEALQTCRKIVNWRKTLSFPADVQMSPAAKDLILRLMNERSKRFTVDDIKKHPFFDGFDWDNVRNRPAVIVPVVKSDVDTSNFDDFEDKVASAGAALQPEDHEGFVGYTYVDENPKRAAVGQSTFEALGAVGEDGEDGEEDSA